MNYNRKTKSYHKPCTIFAEEREKGRNFSKNYNFPSKFMMEHKIHMLVPLLNPPAATSDNFQLFFWFNFRRKLET